ncbi:DMT family transporter [Lactococcus lactis]|uniref:DMT family transporter n=1 Tax=Lactococcus lactis TaxID=1358 RepID=A0A9X4NIC2_9LACT|nr:DMT family transporter [Lactococcus lactis]MDG4983952.1 DMT family transporter [Lactococcus lactis]
MSRKFKGIIYASLGAILFGASSIIATILFRNKSISPEWLVTMRMLGSGVLLLGYLIIRKKDVFTPWKNLKSVVILVSLGIFGVLFAQGSFMLSIYYGNAAVATILQSFGPTVIIIYLAISSRKFPSKIEILAVLLSIVGIFLMVTNGNINAVKVSILSIIFGIISAFGVCAYSLIPRGILTQQNSLIIVGWGLLIGGGVSSIFNPIIKVPKAFDLKDLYLLVIIIVFGTLLAYSLYVNSLIYIEPHVASMLGILEPTVTLLVSIAVFKTSFLSFQVVGIVIIFISLLIINYPSKIQIKQ